jgi:hypothetical protein
MQHYYFFPALSVLDPASSSMSCSVFTILLRVVRTQWIAILIIDTYHTPEVCNTIISFPPFPSWILPPHLCRVHDLTPWSPHARDRDFNRRPFTTWNYDPEVARSEVRTYLVMSQQTTLIANGCGVGSQTAFP